MSAGSSDVSNAFVSSEQRGEVAGGISREGASLLRARNDRSESATIARPHQVQRERTSAQPATRKVLVTVGEPPGRCSQTASDEMLCPDAPRPRTRRSDWLRAAESLESSPNMLPGTRQDGRVLRFPTMAPHVRLRKARKTVRSAAMPFRFVTLSCVLLVATTGCPGSEPSPEESRPRKPHHHTAMQDVPDAGTVQADGGPDERDAEPDGRDAASHGDKDNTGDAEAAREQPPTAADAGAAVSEEPPACVGTLIVHQSHTNLIVSGRLDQVIATNNFDGSQLIAPAKIDHIDFIVRAPQLVPPGTHLFLTALCDGAPMATYEADVGSARNATRVSAAVDFTVPARGRCIVSLGAHAVLPTADAGAGSAIVSKVEGPDLCSVDIEGDGALNVEEPTVCAGKVVWRPATNVAQAINVPAQHALLASVDMTYQDGTSLLPMPIDEVTFSIPELVGSNIQLQMVPTGKGNPLIASATVGPNGIAIFKATNRFITISEEQNSYSLSFYADIAADVTAMQLTPRLDAIQTVGNVCNPKLVPELPKVALVPAPPPVCPGGRYSIAPVLGSSQLIMRNLGGATLASGIIDLSVLAGRQDTEAYLDAILIAVLGPRPFYSSDAALRIVVADGTAPEAVFSPTQVSSSTGQTNLYFSASNYRFQTGKIYYYLITATTLSSLQPNDVYLPTLTFSVLGNACPTTGVIDSTPLLVGAYPLDADTPADWLNQCTTPVDVTADSTSGAALGAIPQPYVEGTSMTLVARSRVTTTFGADSRRLIALQVRVPEFTDELSARVRLTRANGQTFETPARLQGSQITLDLTGAQWALSDSDVTAIEVYAALTPAMVGRSSTVKLEITTTGSPCPQTGTQQGNISVH